MAVISKTICDTKLLFSKKVISTKFCIIYSKLFMVTFGLIYSKLFMVTNIQPSSELNVGGCVIFFIIFTPNVTKIGDSNYFGVRLSLILNTIFLAQNQLRRVHL